MAALNLFLLGGFELCSSAGAPVTVAAKKVKALLAYLAVSAGRAHPRDKLAGLRWEERDEAQARHNLRQALASLRRSLPEVDRVLLAGSETLALQSVPSWASDTSWGEACSVQEGGCASRRSFVDTTSGVHLWAERCITY